jgi:hypothetical protein
MLNLREGQRHRCESLRPLLPAALLEQSAASDGHKDDVWRVPRPWSASEGYAGEGRP